MKKLCCLMVFMLVAGRAEAQAACEPQLAFCEIRKGILEESDKQCRVALKIFSNQVDQVTQLYIKTNEKNLKQEVRIKRLLRRLRIALKNN